MENPKHQMNLYCDLAVPSVMHTASMACAYMYEWFMEKFDSSYFKSTNIDEAHVFKHYSSKKEMIKSLKTLKPSLYINEQINSDYDREKIDFDPLGLKRYTNRHTKSRAFLKDFEKNIHLSMDLEVLEFNFLFRVRVSSRSQQLDLANYMKRAFGVGGTQGKDVDMDMHIPYSIISNLAKAAGFEIKDGKVCDIPEFLKYVNSHSIYPILYKFRNLTGKDEFFMRVSNLYTWIDCRSALSLDDGETEGQLRSNYTIEMNTVLQIGSPKIYSLFSINYSDKPRIHFEDTNNNDLQIGMYRYNITGIPEKNTKGWNKYVSSDVLEEDLKKPLEFNIFDLFGKSFLTDLIKTSVDSYISPTTFMDIYLFDSDRKPIHYSIDWKTGEFRTVEVNKSIKNTLIVYLDMEYVNYSKVVYKDMYKSRFEDTQK